MRVINLESLSFTVNHKLRRDFNQACIMIVNLESLSFFVKSNPHIELTFTNFSVWTWRVLVLLLIVCYTDISLNLTQRLTQWASVSKSSYIETLIGLTFGLFTWWVLASLSTGSILTVNNRKSNWDFNLKIFRIVNLVSLSFIVE